MSSLDAAIASAKNEVICASEFEAHLKYSYDVIKTVMLIPSKDLLDYRFVKQHFIIFYYLVYLLLYCLFVFFYLLYF